jgi:mannosyltransferase OCH1-like enzyme
MIPNIVHFNYGLVEQKEDFLFVYYIAVLSCKIINNPDKIYFHYHYEPKGYWWEKIKYMVDMIKVIIPTNIGSKPLLKTAHKSDILRMNILKKYGGVYFDIDTICVRPYKDLLFNKFVIARETTTSGRNMGLCNAIMMSEPESDFISKWYKLYETYFNPNGWGEASIYLPSELATHIDNLTLLDTKYFLYPDWEVINLIFVNPFEIPDELITLHLWNHHSNHYLRNITNFEWVISNSHTLYGKLLINLLNKINKFSDNNIVDNEISKITPDYIINNLNYNNYMSINNLPNIFTKDNIKDHYMSCKEYNLIPSSIYKTDFILCDNIADKVFRLNYNLIDEININSNIENFSYKIEKTDTFIKIKLDKYDKNYHIQLVQNNKTDILYNLKNINNFYIFTDNLLFDKPIYNIIFNPIICIKGIKFNILNTYLSENEVLLKITRVDINSGWHHNLYIDVIYNNKSYYFYIGKSALNCINVILNVNNKIFDNPNDNENEETVIQIPKIIHMTWKNNPPKYVFEKWEKLNPNHTINFNNDNDCVLFLEKHFGSDITMLFNKIDEGMYKADLWRLCKLYIEGGVYADIDLIPYVPIDNLVKNDNTFYSCLSVNSKSIFQAFMITPPKNLLLLSFILSFIQNKVYQKHNGPTYDMYSCIEQNCNIPNIEANKEYMINTIKINIIIGPSIMNTKIIDLYYFPDDIEYNIYLNRNEYDDTFNFIIKDNKLYITRTGTNGGWGHNHSANIYINTTQYIYLFKEKCENNDWVNSYVLWNDLKIFDSRDLNYYNSKKNNTDWV